MYGISLIVLVVICCVCHGVVIFLSEKETKSVLFDSLRPNLVSFSTGKNPNRFRGSWSSWLKEKEGKGVSSPKQQKMQQQTQHQQRERKETKTKTGKKLTP